MSQEPDWSRENARPEDLPESLGGLKQYLHDKNPGGGPPPRERNLNNYVREHMEFDAKYKMLKEPRDPHHMSYLLVCLAGEVGEVCNEYKKAMRGDGPMDWDHFGEEMVDVFVYLCMLFGYSELDFEEHFRMKMSILHDRWEARTRAGKV